MNRITFKDLVRLLNREVPTFVVAFSKEIRIAIPEGVIKIPVDKATIYFEEK